MMFDKMTLLYKIFIHTKITKNYLAITEVLQKSFSCVRCFIITSKTIMSRVRYNRSALKRQLR